jgi:hypothetical protein
MFWKNKDYEDNFQVQTLGTESHTYHIYNLHLTNVSNKPTHKLQSTSNVQQKERIPQH